MKRIALFLLCFAICFGIAGCGNGTYEEGYQAGYEAAKAETQETGQEQTAETPQPAATEKPETSGELGSRKNPAKIGDPVIINVKSINSGTGSITMTMTEVIKGEAAWEMIYAANQFNNQPTEGMEYILAKFNVTFDKDTSGSDMPLETNRFDFDFSTTDFNVSSCASVVLPEPQFDLKLYEGATGEGYVAFLSPIGEESPKAIYADYCWFDLEDSENEGTASGLSKNARELSKNTFSVDGMDAVDVTYDAETDTIYVLLQSKILIDEATTAMQKNGGTNKWPDVVDSLEKLSKSLMDCLEATGETHNVTVFLRGGTLPYLQIDNGETTYNIAE